MATRVMIALWSCIILRSAEVSPSPNMNADREQTPALRVSRLLLIIARAVNIFGIEVATILVNIIIRVTAHPLRRWWGRSVAVLWLWQCHYPQGCPENCQRQNPVIIMVIVSMWIIATIFSWIWWWLTVVPWWFIPVSGRRFVTTSEAECRPE